MTADPDTGARPGPDGRPRCHWALATRDEREYHDTEWGHTVRDDQGMFERISLEGFQAGLSWLTVLRKREALREVFAGFDPSTVAAYTPADVERMLTDARLIRSRAKIEAVISNARAALDLPGGLAGFVWSYAPDRAPVPRTPAEVPATTPESTAMAAALKRRGFRFVGPTTAYAAMQATGMVDDHLADCFLRRPSSP
ncbi:DNA-3-methyladenine glycosylase I [Haloactinospora alba]|uniref:DNA-3-methyladenine glycosylase I n=1 Tax=Haloactinospora alba TaxID=405555 RepID=A0A543NLQ4_9ACTN|nr:DNA-3-methyladenine glycosylase I [Haloactinospora alba]TQN32763.1 DNA-3-methyladenine glycosylase I [Haloactinospora alba]